MHCRVQGGFSPRYTRRAPAFHFYTLVSISVPFTFLKRFSSRAPFLLLFSVTMIRSPTALLQSSVTPFPRMVDWQKRREGGRKKKCKVRLPAALFIAPRSGRSFAPFIPRCGPPRFLQSPGRRQRGPTPNHPEQNLPVRSAPSA